MRTFLVTLPALALALFLLWPTPSWAQRLPPRQLPANFHVYTCKWPGGCWYWDECPKPGLWRLARPGDVLTHDQRCSALPFNSGWWCATCSPVPGTHRPYGNAPQEPPLPKPQR